MLHSDEIMNTRRLVRFSVTSPSGIATQPTFSSQPKNKISSIRPVAGEIVISISRRRRKNILCSDLHRFRNIIDCFSSSDLSVQK